MIELGKRQLLTVIKKVDFGVYLAEEQGDAEEKVLLPIKQVPAGAGINDKIAVFIYRDSKDRLIATINEPMLEVGQFACLKVKQVGKFGAFLDWGLEKDLLLPFKEQTTSLKAGDECMAALYVDKSNRLCATMKVYHYLQTGSPYKKDDKVEGIVYEISPNFGTFVAVDERYSALIPKSEPSEGVKVGDRILARVTEVKEDGKLSLSIREKAYVQIDTDAKKLLDMLKASDGYLPFGDKSAPELIREKTGMSKNEFKKAAGNLYKQRLIEIQAESMRLVKGKENEQ